MLEFVFMYGPLRVLLILFFWSYFSFITCYCVEVETLSHRIRIQEIRSFDSNEEMRLLIVPKFPIDADVYHGVKGTNIKIKNQGMGANVEQSVRRSQVWHLKKSPGESPFTLEIRAMVGKSTFDHLLISCESREGVLHLIQEESYSDQYYQKEVTAKDSLSSELLRKHVYSILLWFCLCFFQIFLLKQGFVKSIQSKGWSLFSFVLLVFTFSMFCYFVDSIIRDYQLDRSGWDVAKAKVVEVKELSKVGASIVYEVPGLKGRFQEFVFMEDVKVPEELPVFFSLADPNLNAIHQLYRAESFGVLFLFVFILYIVLLTSVQTVDYESRLLFRSASAFQLFLIFLLKMGASAFLGYFLVDYGSVLWTFLFVFLAA